MSSSDLNTVIKGRVWKFGDSIDTDCINPFYQYPDPQELKLHAMESERPEFASSVRPGDIIVAGRNFGCGSARDGKVLFELGISVIVADSFSTIFLRNGISGGDLLLKVPGVSDLVEDGDTLEIDYSAGMLRNLTSGKTLAFQKYPAMIENLFRMGGFLPYIKARYDAEQSTASTSGHGPSQ